MKCSYCGGLVTWRGPLTDLTHTECESCGRQNCQEAEPVQGDEDEELDDYGNPLDGSEVINCCFPDCGCDGARLCMAKNGASFGARSVNLERGSLSPAAKAAPGVALPVGGKTE